MIVVLGGGQLGSEFRRFYSDREALFVSRKDLDLENFFAIERLFSSTKITTLINAAAYTHVDKAEQERSKALKLNSDLPGLLADLCFKNSVKLVHFSSDYVFDGKKNEPYTEDDQVCPVNFYGETKLLGDKNVLMTNPSSLIIRTSWVYSEFGNNFLKTMMRLTRDLSDVKVVDDQVGSPTWTKDLVRVVDLSLRLNLKGLYNYSSLGHCSWYDFASEIKCLCGHEANLIPIKSTDYNSLAVRPSFSLLSKKKIQKHLNINILDWLENLKHFPFDKL
jgi:dTDP-4-dehydrorhamnose reductase